MPDIATLNTLRFYELGPIIERMDDGSRLGLVNTETEIKNLYRILRVLQPLINSLAARGDLLNISLDSVGAGTSLIHDNTLPDWFLRSLVAGTNITITLSADEKEITITSTGAADTHQISDATIHLDVAGSTTPAFVDTNEEDGSWLTWDDTTSPSVHQRWELSRIGNAGLDVDTGADRRLGCFRGYEANILNFGSNNSIGGRHTMRMIETVSGSFLKLNLEVTTEDIQISFDKANFNLTDVNDVTIGTSPSPLNGALLTFVDSLGRWEDKTSTMRFTRVDATTAGPEHNFRSARGSVGSETGALSGDELGEISFRGHDNTGSGQGDSKFNVGARIRATATQNFSNTANGTKLEFFTVDNGSATLDLRMTVDQDGTVDVAQGLVALTLTSDVATGTAPFAVTSTTESVINVHHLDAAGTGRDWDDVEHTKQIFLPRVVTVGASEGWVTGSSGPSLASVADASPPSEYAGYACRIPGSWKSASTVTLKWRFHNAAAQSGGDQKVVEWRIAYNSPGASGVISAADTAAPTNTLDTDQAINTIKTQSITLSNIAADDLLNVTISVDDGSTTATGDIIVLDCPWIEATLQGVPDTGSAA